ncbi:hypothetical protein MA16_Dca015810 [Dendrobium catenatum]|uniref:Uncharacterized protein n=1 Tax=Dendrobium catenatum TaxID=906689 RepID=A0A2I0WS72_9ASPA|nr:hypothetical protein MA16_Dca015810 [Dendrobium catenatum]
MRQRKASLLFTCSGLKVSKCVMRSSRRPSLDIADRGSDALMQHTKRTTLDGSISDPHPNSKSPTLLIAN